MTVDGYIRVSKEPPAEPLRVEWADGGLSTPSNIQVLCLSHNSSKGAQRKGKSAQQKLSLDPDPPTLG
jgi:hypothetical protein